MARSRRNFIKNCCVLGAAGVASQIERLGMVSSHAQTGAGYKAPDFQPSGHPWALDPGYYVLTIKPGTAGKGILDLRVAAEGATGDGGAQAKETALLFPAIHLDSGARYTLHLNDQPGVRTGVVLRRHRGTTPSLTHKGASNRLWPPS